ncbi:hypothetical protein [Legionella longbeachae]|uniref:Uncharacterized protein n=1 Tax=Legionella longbeachae serogroup 1 (strain NSW150) TaxID=661367 RepID=D3HLV5_LEGLN|nr:hypothetical protein [Legionella longbeachae]VEE03864.1 Uncharacterised protein [Legionella oakridgensis]HBD7397354.1 hypothetical protein [Legionella pneumophila]ARB93277.1 hypothetical protein A6J40_14315 [Legionella longbeachae]ARM33659.1 hypothetical protein B0B39_09025 [Legionella longbeachae]EEZ93500.1 hypothetical protein LLB_2386 [Legionella longbeachae D-4968]
MYPPAYMLARQSTTDIHRDNLIFKRNDLIVVNIHGIHKIYQKGINDLQAIEQFIIHRQQGKCRVIDMSLYAFLQVIQQTPLDIPIRSYVTTSEAIQSYLSSLKGEFRY